MARARKLFEVLVNETVELLPEEAELAKLFTNAYRYLKFALANQLYMMANDFGLDYERIRQGVIHNYPRAADLPAAGFCRWPMPAQGHDAAGGFQQQQLRARPRRHDGQRGLASLPGRPALPPL